MSIREFRFDEDADYRALAAMRAEVYPEYPLSEAEMRGDDAIWGDSRYGQRVSVQTARST